MLLIAMLTRVRRLAVPQERTATKTELISYHIASRVLQDTTALSRLLVAPRRLFNAQRITIAWVVFTMITLHTYVQKVSIALLEQTYPILAPSVATAQVQATPHLQVTVRQDITAHSS